ncbi:hypothetical protein [Amycolatopsis jejuensis]|uniref:hypothetical protein n=1 Tax=Amycolatopsis jejuensis TaxID=330084 RepID=UPI0012E0AF99|nr:hypothetical protein [Amycolatopsis jejuensis]
MKPIRTTPAGRRAFPLLAALLVTGCAATGQAGQQGGTGAIPEKNGPGVDADTITFAVPGSGGLATTGGSDNGTAVRDAIVAMYNDRGGIAHRKIRLVNQAGEASGDSTLAQAECAAIAAQQPAVFAVLGITRPPSVLTSCLNSRGIVGILAGGFGTAAVFRNAPATAGIDLLTDTRLARSWPRILQQTGWLAGAGRVAVVIDQSYHGAEPPDPEIPKLLESGLVAAGAPKPDVHSLPADAAAGKAAALDLVLKLKTSGADRVVLVGDATGALPDLLLEAGKQQYFPRIAASAHVAGAMVAFGADPALRAAATPIEWRRMEGDSLADNEQAVADLKRDNASARRCLEAIDRAGGDPQAKETGRTTGLDLCQSLDLVAAALERSGSSFVNAEAFAAGLQKIGSFPAMRGFANRYGPGDQGGTAAVQPLAYRPDCSCYRPTGTPADLPS